MRLNIKLLTETCKQQLEILIKCNRDLNERIYDIHKSLDSESLKEDKSLYNGQKIYLNQLVDRLQANDNKICQLEEEIAKLEQLVLLT